MAGGITSWGLANPQAVGFSTTVSSGTAVPTAATAFTKGAWTQLSSPLLLFDATWCQINICCTSIVFSGEIAVDIGVGPSGSQTAIINNIQMSCNLSQNASLFLPLALPINTRLWARAAGNSNHAENVRIGLTVFDDGED